MKRWGGLLLQWSVLLVGIGLLLYPHLTKASTWWQTVCTVQHLEQHKQQLTQASQTDIQKQQADQLLQAMEQYNRQIAQTQQYDLKDAWSYEQAPLELEQYGLQDQAVAVLRIPAIDLELAVYLGATEENLAKGAAVLGQTSMPIGGTDTNCVLAAHRGYRGAPMLLDVEELAIGDRVQLENLWQTLDYEVQEIRIIDPSQVEAIHIQPGRDLLTLITCHPYPHNTQRYVVYCQRVANEAQPEVQSEQLSQSTPTPQEIVVKDSSRQAIERERRINALGLVAAVVLLLGALTKTFWKKKGSRAGEGR